MALKIVFGVLLILASGVLLFIGVCGAMLSGDDTIVAGALALGAMLVFNGIVLLVRCATPTPPAAGAAGATLIAIGIFGAFSGIFSGMGYRSSGPNVAVLVGSGICLLLGGVLVAIRDKARIQREIEQAFYDDEDYDDEEYADDDWIDDEPRWDDA